MSGTADPWEPVGTGALAGRVTHRPMLERSGGPERIYDATNADPDWKPRTAGFTAPVTSTHDPLTWEGDGA